MSKSTKTYKLIIFDLDGTLVLPFSEVLEPGVKTWYKNFRKHNKTTKLAIATNKGNIGLKYWREVVRAQGGDIGDPNANGWTVESTLEQVYNVAKQIEATPYVCFRYQSKKGNWSPVPPMLEDDPRWSEEWRKPNPGMLLSAIRDFKASPPATLMVGNSEEDRLAAESAGCDYVDGDEFFKPFRPKLVITWSRAHAWDWLSYTEGLDKAKTEELYANMLASCARFDKLDVELREKKTSDLESFRLVNAEDSEHEDRIANMVFKSIMDQWINKKWLKFDTIDQHINALIDGEHLNELIVAPVYMRDLYTKEEYEAAKPAFDRAESFKRKFRFYLG